MVKIKENPIKMDDLGVPLFLETSIWVYDILMAIYGYPLRGTHQFLWEISGFNGALAASGCYVAVSLEYFNIGQLMGTFVGTWPQENNLQIPSADSFTKWLIGILKWNVGKSKRKIVIYPNEAMLSVVSCIWHHWKTSIIPSFLSSTNRVSTKSIPSITWMISELIYLVTGTF